MSKRVQLCAGGNRLEGWENYDRDCDITKPLPFADNSVDIVFCEHGAEHQNSHQFLRFCDECYRVLKPGGTLRLCMPVIERLDPAHARDIILGHGHEATYTTEVIEQVLRVVGFAAIKRAPRALIDHHWRVIGREKDDAETARVEATK